MDKPFDYTQGKPTQEQIEEFWKRCGIREEVSLGYHTFYTKEGDFISSNYMGNTPLEPDLNNLFKYATDRVKEKIGEKEYFKLLVSWCGKVAMGEDPADTLFTILE